MRVATCTMIGCAVGVAISPSVYARTLSPNEAVTAQLLDKVVKGNLGRPEIVDVTVLFKGDFGQKPGLETVPSSLVGCEPSGVSEQKQAKLIPDGYGTLSGKNISIVDAVLDCSRGDTHPHFARVSAMFDKGKLEMLVFREGLG